MQSYFRLSASSRLRRPLSIFGLPEQYQKAAEKDVFDHLDQAIVAYFRAEARGTSGCSERSLFFDQR